jgi:1-acyl-sn-glycerol-3-phosphate acyltransferase
MIERRLKTAVTTLPNMSLQANNKKLIPIREMREGVDSRISLFPALSIFATIQPVMGTYKEFQNQLRTEGCYETVHPAGTVPAPVTVFNSLRYDFTIVWLCTVCVVKELFGKFDFEQWAKATYASIAFAEKIRGRLIFEGFDALAQCSGPVVYVSNHMSTLETMVLPVTLLSFNPISIVLKESLANMPLVGRAFARLGCIGVTRKNPRADLQTVLKVGEERLKSGRSVLLFPEGTRQDLFDPAKFNSLGAKLAHRAGVPVVPIAVKTDFLQKGKLIRDFGMVDASKPVHIACGAVLAPELGAKEMHARCVAFIDGKLKQWQNDERA